MFSGSEKRYFSTLFKHFVLDCRQFLILIYKEKAKSKWMKTKLQI